MSTSRDAEFREAVSRLHRTKDASYRDAWKKRGEVISVLANIARKVDRLEYVLDGAPTTRDESLFDTVIDLFVYALKYQTLLADLDREVAAYLYYESGLSGPYSDGTAGFENLLLRLDMDEHATDRVTVGEATSRVVTCFGDIAACFVGVSTPHPAMTRQAYAEALVDAALLLISTLQHEDPALYDDFLVAISQGTR